MGLKVLHLPTSVGGNSWGLSLGERALGIDSRVLVAEQNWLGYPYDMCLNLQNRSWIEKLYKMVKAFFEIRNGYDVYHFNFGSSLIDIPSHGINLLDLPFYKGKKIMTYNGCDARQKYATIERTKISACHNHFCYKGICNSGKRDKIKKLRIKKASCYVQHIFALNPDILWFLPQDKTTFLPYTVSTWYDEFEVLPIAEKKKLRIVHAPTDKGCKGTEKILNAVDFLQQRYPHEFEFALVQNLPHSEAIRIYNSADLVIDQLLVGWYGAVSVEVMRMGKPVIVYIRDEDLIFIPKEMRKDIYEAFITCSTETLIETLEYYIHNRKELKEKAANALEFVNRWHDPHKIALHVKEIYESC